MGAQRPAGFARHLPAFGWRAIVLCCDSTQRRTATENDLPEIAARATEAVRRGADQTSVVMPTPSLRWDGIVDHLWTAASNDNQPGALKRFVRKTLTAAKYLTGDYSQAWQPCARRAAEAIATEVKVDACIGEHSPDAGLFLARWFSRKYGVPWVADFRDPILRPLTPLARALYKPQARRLLRSAAGVIDANRVWAELDQELWARPTWSIPNGFEADEFAAPLPTVRNDKVTVVYTGNIRPAQKIEVFLEGMALVKQALGPAVADNLRLIYRGGVSDTLLNASSRIGVQDLVDCGDRIARDQSLALQRRADMLLLLSLNGSETDIYLRNGLYPGKAFEYFGARRPILCVPGDGGLLDNLIQETRTGVILHTPQAVADYLIQAIAERQHERAVPYQPDEDAVTRYTRQRLTGKLADVLNFSVTDHDGARSL